MQTAPVSSQIRAPQLASFALLKAPVDHTATVQPHFYPKEKLTLRPLPTAPIPAVAPQLKTGELKPLPATEQTTAPQMKMELLKANAKKKGMGFGVKTLIKMVILGRFF